jgi:SAM-dependent methyltransferase
MQSLQQEVYGPAHDYVTGSPHLKHRCLRERLLKLIRDEIKAQGGLPTVLEVGGGHGGYTEPVLASGCAVTATETSLPSVERLRDQYGLNPRFSALFDPDGTLAVVGDRTFTFVLCASVLHHIPDYASFLTGPALDHLAPGGTIVTIQDPLWYPSVRRLDSVLTTIGYFSWRITRGGYLDGARTRVRRLRRVYDESVTQDMVEYHVVRSGVNHAELERILTPRFESVCLVPYWSSQSPTWQRVGERLRRCNTFALVARGFRG